MRKKGQTDENCREQRIIYTAKIQHLANSQKGEYGGEWVADSQFQHCFVCFAFNCYNLVVLGNNTLDQLYFQITLTSFPYLPIMYKLNCSLEGTME